MHPSKKTGLALATAAAALLTSPLPAQAMHHLGEVKCSGVNSCKGTSDCRTARSACKGQNGCKGQGWVMKKNTDECKKAGGTVIEVKK